MRREINHLRLQRIWPWLIWKDCVGCGQEFRRESGWRFYRVLVMGNTWPHYICASCAPSRAEASNIAWEYIQKAGRPWTMRMPKEDK